MSQQPPGDKTEKASAQKLRKAREQGQVARSRDIGTAVGLLVCLKLILLALPWWLTDFRQLFALALPGAHGSLEDAASMLFPATLALLAKMLLPLLAVPLCILLASLFPGGWVLSAAPLRFRFDRFNPVSNLGKLVAPKHFATTAMLVLKAAAVIAVLWWLSAANLQRFAALQGTPLGPAMAGGAQLLVDTALWLCAVLVVFALLDVPVQKLMFMREQRMSRHEMKEEHKHNEGRPEVKQRMRQLRQLLSQRGLRRVVPQADVVVVNPTHYAVAIKYDQDRAQAPYVVAKGVDESALFIRQLAQTHGVEVLTVPPLARAIYHSSQVNQQIPAALYDAVAQVLIYVLQVQAFRRGERRAQPRQPTRFDIPAELLTPEPA